MLIQIKQKQEARVKALQDEVDSLQQELGQARSSRNFPFSDAFSSAGKDAEAIVKRHIRLLHQYNESKDAAQVRRLCLAG